MAKCKKISLFSRSLKRERVVKPNDQCLNLWWNVQSPHLIQVLLSNHSCYEFVSLAALSYLEYRVSLDSIKYSGDKFNLKSYHHNIVDFIPGIQHLFSIYKLTDKIYQINWFKGRNQIIRKAILQSSMQLLDTNSKENRNIWNIPQHNKGYTCQNYHEH